jgi:hypothetical protein
MDYTDPATTTNILTITYTTQPPKKQAKRCQAPKPSKNTQPQQNKREKVKNNWHSSLGQFSKIELEGNQDKARPKSRAFALSLAPKTRSPDLYPYF